MSVVKINVLTVPAEMREELERRFSGRAGIVESADGFEWFELLRPVEGTDQYMVYTRWRSEEDFKRWTDSQSFQKGHAQAGGQEQGHGHGQAAGQGHGHGQGPAATGSQLWSFEVVQSTGPASASGA
ncbi:antibiotic biosynthesis monooxygenase family protein [Streptosporangium canum]|uniref:Heme-degrading monooxygenase HmoA n=1 Tax=Streptosporangium canum TaxID=324952 RepID=A0A1I3ZV81_9ACTN|nr:antibiotic biosynthesis monooxygenase [Streptosporangium canum]SFK47536.1 Heme-degrading monooxygenase HmoA [Streptosporangium canum]